MMENILEIKDLSKTFSGIHAVENCNFVVKRGSITGLIGPNGAGKTTMFNLISGLLSPTGGEIYFEGKGMAKVSSHKRSRMGLGRSFQRIRLFEELTALENLMVAFNDNRESFWWAFGPFKKHQGKLRARAMNLLEEVDLSEKANLKVYELSYGQKKLLEILRAKAGDKQLILLDEPTAGINPTMIKKVEKLIKSFKAEGRTVLIVEHNMPFIMSLCETVIVMDQGKDIAVGKPKDIQQDAKVLEAYLGKKSKK